MIHVEFTDPRLVAIYDTVNPYAADAQPGFYSQLAADVGAVTIVDLGCGTGLITAHLALQGYRMIGVDPAPGMLDVARRKVTGHAVQWIDGGADCIGTPGADLAIMSGHVAQFFVDDARWAAALDSLHRALRPGGRLAFESRNPQAREWERWTREEIVSGEDPAHGPVASWCEVDDASEGIVMYRILYAFARTGEKLVAPGRLRFRSESEITQSLTAAGFTVEHVYGDWDRRAAGRVERELIFVAVA